MLSDNHQVAAMKPLLTCNFKWNWTPSNSYNCHSNLPLLFLPFSSAAPLRHCSSSRFVLHFTEIKSECKRKHKDFILTRSSWSNPVHKQSTWDFSYPNFEAHKINTCTPINKHPCQFSTPLFHSKKTSFTTSTKVPIRHEVIVKMYLLMAYIISHRISSQDYELGKEIENARESSSFLTEFWILKSRKRIWIMCPSERTSPLFIGDLMTVNSY